MKTGRLALTSSNLKLIYRLDLVPVYGVLLSSGFLFAYPVNFVVVLNTIHIEIKKGEEKEIYVFPCQQTALKILSIKAHWDPSEVSYSKQEQGLHFNPRFFFLAIINQFARKLY
ncbi:hypothetical protein BD560DRAFT_423891 [Blakeslea trispora]|nr:hypothetical protein BD560DRAFT_423891 [Blakeslea trispora]